LQKGYDEIFSKFEGSPTWLRLCGEVFDLYLGQYSFTPVAQIDFLARELGISSRSHVLDLASGTGGLSCYLAKVTGCRVTGVDASLVAVRIANRRAMLEGLSHHVSFEVGVLPELPYADGCFDAVISVDSVYGIPDKTRLFRGCFRVLKEGGYIGFYTLYKRKRFSVDTPMRARALYWFPLKPYSALLEEVGFEGVSKVDFTRDFVRLTSLWVEAMRRNKEALEREMGGETAEGLLTGDIRMVGELAKEGSIGRALFKARKPL
jgi:cyclopropane fatty-acyl-phospholipid synthase-like methyltransferase